LQGTLRQGHNEGGGLTRASLVEMGEMLLALCEELRGRCPLCGRERPNLTELSDGFEITCELCKTYRIAEDYFLPERPLDEAKRQLSAIVRRRFEFTGRPMEITAANWQDLASSAPRNDDVLGKIRCLLQYIAHKSHFPGEAVILSGHVDYPVCFAANLDEFGYYATYLKDAGLVNGQRLDNRGGDYRYWLTPKGWQELQHVATLESPYGFVAMSFSKTGPRATLLADAFKTAIEPAIEKAGYKPVRIDREEFLGDIVFEIMARIKESRFVVADFTEHKNGVYFEAGYALGRDLPVIWMCHEKDLDGAHFDIEHMNHIVWDDLTEMRKRLETRILANIGRGPVRSPE
jgi:hypothetical protein